MSFTARYNFLLCVVLGITLLAGCAGRARKQRASGPKHPSATQHAAVAGDAKPSISGVKFDGKAYRLVFPTDGPRVLAVDARSLRANTEAKRLEMTGVDCLLYEQGQKRLRVTAQSGQVALDGKDVRVALTGNIRAVEDTQHLQLTADRFHWSSVRGTIIATHVRWQGLGFDHRADKGTFATDLSRATFSGHIRTTYSASR